MRAVDLIRKKRDSGEHSRDEIDFLIRGYTRGDIPDYQMSAWLMAVWLRGMNGTESAALTEAMLYSGEVVDLSEIAGKKWISIRREESETIRRWCWRRSWLRAA